ncbi:restriction endonuclease subunit S [Lactobacillus delbrueckii subsp. bulgaricus]
MFAWEQCKLGDVFAERSEKSQDGNEELLSVTLKDGVIKSESLDRKNTASLDKRNYKLVIPNDIAYNSMRMWQGALGVSKFSGIVSPAYTVIKLRNQLENPYFYQYYFKKNEMLNVFRKNSQGLTSDTWNLKYPLFSRIRFFTASTREQQQISSLLYLLDQTITLHEEKKHQLERLKSALLQKMFADKSGYPDIRFEGFSDEWEQCKAKELFESKSKKDHSDLPVLSATQENGIVFRNDLDIDIKFDTHALSNYKVVSPGDYIISLRSFQGGFELSEKLGIISPAYTVFAFNNQEEKRHNNTFWKYLFKRYDFIESLKRLTFGIRDGKAISFTQFSTLKLSFPNFDEQNKIAKLLHELDRTITLHDQKLNLLKLVKQSLLQNMFI